MANNRRGVIVTNIETGEETAYDSMVAAAQAIGVSLSIVFNCCALRQKWSHGYMFRYAEERTGELTEQHARVIMAMACNQLRPRRAARSLGYDDKAIRYHVDKIRRITGKDPHDFWDMIELVKTAEKILQEG